MKLSDHVDTLRNLIEGAFDKQFARLGIGASKQLELEKLPSELHDKRQRFEEMLENHVGETGCYKNAREKLLDELTFTLFNRIAAIKVMEAASLFPPIITKQPEHGDRSFGHKAWLEMRPDMRNEELEGIRGYIKHAFNELGETLTLYSKEFPYALLPDAISLNDIIDAFNAVENDPQVEANIWQSDDILGWLYESYNNTKKQAFKDSDEKTEYDKVSLQSQVYTPRWVVRFLVENSLGKLYLEMYPDSAIKTHYKIANAPKTQERKPKPLHEIKLIDPACGSGNFLLYAFDFFYALYLDQIENYGADYAEADIPKLIIENNLHGIDLDDRAVQLAQLGLYIKARKKRRSMGNLKFNVVSSDFFLPDYAESRHIFEEGTNLDKNQKELIADIWSDLQYAYKFGSLIRLDEKLKAKLNSLEAKQESKQNDVFISSEISEHKGFSAIFFNNLKTAVEQYAQALRNNTFLASKTRDAITFLELLTTKYDVATANPPYTDSSDFGSDLKTFIENNYKKPYKFNTNLYATFIKRCYEFVGEDGFIAMLHPLTFMYIKTFEDVRKFILAETNINLLAELGLGGVFANSDVQVDVCMYVLKKGDQSDNGVFFDLKTYKNHSNKPNIFSEIYMKFIHGIEDKHVFSTPQFKLKIIKSFPFIYWISDEFREKFKRAALEKEADVISGVKTGNNNGALRFWWEINSDDLYDGGNEIKWVRYTKGGPFKKWYGNNWLCVNYENNAAYIRKQNSFNLVPDKYTYVDGISYSGSGSKGINFRFKSKYILYDMGASAVFPKADLYYAIAALNSKLVSYITDCLNPTVNKQPNDVKRIPLPKPNKNALDYISPFSKINIDINQFLEKFSVIEIGFQKSPFVEFATAGEVNNRIRYYFNYENHLLTQVLLNEAIINEKIFDVYDLTESDKALVLAKEGESIGGLPVSAEARTAYLAEEEATKEFPLDNIRNFAEALPEKEFTAEDREAVESEFSTLYQGNNTLEEFCIRHQINPINVWYWFKQSSVIPKQRMNILAMEFLADIVREILMEDDDGIVSLVPNAGEKILLDRIEEKFREKGFSTAQFANFDSVLGRPLNEYLNKDFFAELSDHLKLFKQLPATPFIWHLSSGPEQGFDCYIIIYKWSRDKLMRLRSVYIEHRERALMNRQSDLANNDSADAQNEKDKIFKQLKEIDAFKVKIEELLAEGYNPILDDGVGKNIAPLQKKKMIPYEVLNPGQLKKYLNADW
ncbi:BREX-1 system adenine-specific DNA-methyltransferase PglX [Methylicorpusculum oleiharenae]|uniref:BREX-1 system adenine-specific DNA-methyltransferase PglX n=1 Tax=Methylicorpusculum oleiharenae TaxID=1338687 RepID=UPI001357A22F|nr:BREX-1 system adenine-specific DNA-methyltransferase PglX [Methylicorpusculum oleiharenae]MCD2450193.1 BREX-1 system adenine-specific DNA-methyltransferase PglX [Methylicorpusculum oleiharenae]